MVTNIILVTIYIFKINYVVIKKYKKCDIMRFELCKWEFKPILMNVEYRTNDRLDFIKNMIALIKLIELENNICINRENMFDYIQIFDLKNNLQNNELLDYLENESLESLDKLEI